MAYPLHIALCAEPLLCLLVACAQATIQGEAAHDLGTLCVHNSL